MRAPQPGDRPVTPTEEAALLMAALTRKGWTFNLDAAGRLHTIIGDPLEGGSIDVTLQVLNDLQDACRLLLIDVQGVH